MFGFGKYNYDAFTKDMLEKELETESFSGPEAGERAPDFEARTLDGDKVRLSDFEGKKNVVLTFGSATCPMTAGALGGINDLHQAYDPDDVQFLFVYVREAHPGDELAAHSSMEEKVRAAELLRSEEEVDLPIIVDDVRGNIHRRYSKLPNPTFIIDKSGRVAFRCKWTQPDVVEKALDELLERQEERDVEHAIVNGGEDSSMPLTYAMLYAHRALDRGGRKAKQDFRDALGVRGTLALAASRVAEPIALNPGKTLAGVALTGGVIAGAVYLGRQLRNRRFAARGPYRVHEGIRPSDTVGGDYEAVGI